MGLHIRLTASIILLTSSTVADEGDSQTQARLIIDQWAASVEEADRVAGHFTRYTYDHTFEVQTFGQGQFGYESSGHAFIKNEPLPSDNWKDVSQKTNAADAPYKLQQDDSYQWRWQPGRIFVMNDDKQEAKLFVVPTRKPRESEWFAMFSWQFSGIDRMIPFLPGLPDPSATGQWTYELSSRTEQQIAIRAVPLPDSYYRQNYHEIDLTFSRDPLRLDAIRLIDCSGTKEEVYVFDQVTFDPVPIAEPDLSHYNIREIGTPSDPERVTGRVTRPRMSARLPSMSDIHRMRRFTMATGFAGISATITVVCEFAEHCGYVQPRLP